MVAKCSVMAGVNLSMDARRTRNLRFDSTRWSVVRLCAADPARSAQERQALGEFCQIYWPPIHAFLLRRGYQPADAQDLTQSFFAHLLKHQAYAAADPAKGKFRTFLLVALRNFLADHHARERADKRGGAVQSVPLTTSLLREEPAFVDQAADRQHACWFDQQWAAALVERALSMLGAELAEEGKQRLFVALQPALGLSHLPAPRQEKLAADLQMPVATLRTHLHRLRLRFRSLLREEVARTVATSNEVEQELRHLFQILVAR